jgi:hypothetical protein
MHQLCRNMHVAGLIGLTLLLAGASAIPHTCPSDGTYRTFYTISQDEHAPACLFHITEHTRCTHAPTDYFSVPTLSGSPYLENYTFANLELSANECTSQFRRRIFASNTISGSITSFVFGASRSSSCSSCASEPYVLYKDIFAQAGELTLEKFNSSLSTSIYLVTSVTLYSGQTAQPHGIRKADEEDNNLVIALATSTGALGLLVAVLFGFMVCGRKKQRVDERNGSQI